MNPKQIWFKFDVGEFHEHTDCSIRSIRYALKSLREAENSGIRFRTVFDRSIGPRGAWCVLYAQESTLKYDQEPLFRTKSGQERHVRKSLRDPEVSATPIKGRDTTYLSRSKTPSKSRESGVISPDGEKKLLRFASAVARRLERRHWDNCKVDWEFVPVRGAVFRWLREGIPEAEIGKAYDHALHHAHMMATDIGLNHGNPFNRFKISSTIKWAGKRISTWAKGSSRQERIEKIYRERRELSQRVRAELEKAFS